MKALDGLRNWITADDPRLALAGVLFVCLLAGLLVGVLFGGLGPVLAVGAIGATIAGLLMLRSTDWGLYALVALIALLPYAALPVKVVFTPTFLDLILVALFAVWLARLVTGAQRTFVASALGLPIFVFMFWALVTFIVGLGHASLTPNVLRHFVEVLLAVALFFVAVNRVRRVEVLERISRALLLAGGGTALLGIVFYFIPGGWTVAVLGRLGRFGYPTDGILRYIEDNPENPMRAISTSIDPNALGGLLVILTVVAVAHLFAERPILPRFYLALISGTMVLCLILTFSRGSMAGVAAALVVMGVLRYRKLLWVMALGAALVIILPQTQFYVSRFIEGVQGQDLATQMRFGEYKDALILISRNQLLGVGFAGAPDIDLYIGVSNVYLLVAEQMGLVGLALFVLVLLVFWIVAWRAWRRLPAAPARGRLEGPLLGYSLALVGAAVSGIFDHFFFNISFVHLVSLFWLVMGLGVATALLVDRQPEEAMLHLDSSRPG
ncbi:MAG: O-antigen ligase family protein [Anaerolineae bacterium]